MNKSSKYSFFFASLISPNFISNFATFFNYNTNLKKIQLKQSYVLLTWFYYLTFLEKKEKKIINFFVLPIKRKTSTVVKAPMAHKNWSKEQFEQRTFFLKISFKNNFAYETLPNSVNAGLLFVLISKKLFPVFETNIFFLKNYKITFYISELNYFNNLTLK